MNKKIVFELEGLCPMSTEELTQTFGGGWWTDFKEGFKEGWNWAKGAIGEIAAIFVIAGKIRNSQ
ncbi:MAG: hypothetical protein RJA76_554 [Bacteroidota bacterium]|jgi:hypothetical protein